MMAPDSRSRAAGGASFSAGTSLTLAAPSGIGWPLVAILSLIVTGTPSSVPVGSPFCQRSVDARAVARAPIGIEQIQRLDVRLPCRDVIEHFLQHFRWRELL